MGRTTCTTSRLGGARRRLAAGPVGMALLASVALGGCSIERMAADNMAGVFAKTKDDFNRVHVARYAREAGPSLLATLNGFVLASPNNPVLRLLQAEMNATFAFAFLEVEDPAWALFHYGVAEQAALVALAREDRPFARDLPTLDGDELEARLERLDEDALPAAFWWAFARGSSINLRRGDPGAVAGLGRVDAVMKWVLEREPGFYNGGPHLYFAMRHVALPASLGGDAAKGVAHFDAVDAITGGRMLIARVLRAQHHAPGLAAAPAGAPIAEVLAAQERAWRAWFEALDGVVKAPKNVWPEEALSNAVAKERARALLRDPEANNIIPPPSAVNPYAAPTGGDWAGGGGWGGDDGAWDEGDWGQ